MTQKYEKTMRNWTKCGKPVLLFIIKIKTHARQYRPKTTSNAEKTDKNVLLYVKTVVRRVLKSSLLVQAKNYTFASKVHGKLQILR